MKDFMYTREGTAKLRTAIGTLDTVIVASRRSANDSRVLRMWFAPALGFVPVQAERTRDGKLEFAMRIRTTLGSADALRDARRVRLRRRFRPSARSRRADPGTCRRDPVRGLADLVRLEEQHLRDAFVRVDLRGQRRRVRELERHVPFPLGFQGRYVHDDSALRSNAKFPASGTVRQ